MHKIFIVYLILVSGVVMAKNSHWDESRIQIGHQFLHIKLPPNESKDFPPNASLQLVNLNDERLDIDAQSVTAVDKYWDFREGLFKGVQGTLNIQVRVRKVPSTFKGDITNFAELEKLLIERLSKSESEVPSHFIPEIINNRNWLSYHLKEGSGFTFYVYPLTESIYLQVQAHFINNSKDANPKWLNNAHKMLDGITTSMVLGRSN